MKKLHEGVYMIDPYDLAKSLKEKNGRSIGRPF